MLTKEVIDLSMNAAVGAIETYLGSLPKYENLSPKEITKLTHEVARKVAEQITAAPLDEQLY